MSVRVMVLLPEVTVSSAERVGGQGIELNLPFALLIGLRGFGLVGEPDLYRSFLVQLSQMGVGISR